MLPRSSNWRVWLGLQEWAHYMCAEWTLIANSCVLRGDARRPSLEYSIFHSVRRRRRRHRRRLLHWLMLLDSMCVPFASLWRNGPLSCIILKWFGNTTASGVDGGLRRRCSNQRRGGGDRWWPGATWHFTRRKPPAGHANGRRRRRRWRWRRRRGRGTVGLWVAVPAVRVESVLSAGPDDGAEKMVPSSYFVAISFSSFTCVRLKSYHKKCEVCITKPRFFFETWWCPLCVKRICLKSVLLIFFIEIVGPKWSI